MNFKEFDKFTIKNLKNIIKKIKNKGYNLNLLKEYIKKEKFNKRVLFLGGDQITGSLSPLIHTSNSIQHKNNNFFYTLFNLKGKNNNEIVENFYNIINENNQILGANITMPYKILMFDFLKNKDSLDDSAILAGAVNTIAKSNLKIKGYNTDIDGILLPIKKQLGKKIKDINTSYILGAGGSAQATVVALLKLGIKNIKIFNRSHNKAYSTIEHFNSKKIRKILKNNKDYKLEYIKYDILDNENNKISKYILERGIFVNTLPFGFKKDLPLIPILKSEYKIIKDKISLFFDIVYDMNYLDTPIIELLKKDNIKTCDGIDMLLNQAVKGFKLWTSGKRLDIEKLNKILR